MATLKQNSEALRAITDKLKSLPKRHVLTEVTLTPSKDDVVAVPNGGEAFSKVTVEGDTNLVAENIAEGVSIFGVTGTHSGGSTGGGDIDALIDRSITEVSSGVTSIGASAFRDCISLTSVNIPNATSIGSGAFRSCSALTSVNFTNATSIGEYAFYECFALTDANIPNATVVGDRAFQNCYALTSVNLPNATSIGILVFHDCYALTSVNLPNVKRISTFFGNCYSLTSVNLPNATEIVAWAFQQCFSLKSLVLRSETVCSLENTNAFRGCYHILGTVDSQYNPTGAKDGYIYVPANLVESYKSATNWSTYASQIRAIDEGGGEVEGNWLFQNEQISGYTVTGLPAPVDGVSYTCFVDGEEIGTGTCESGQLRFNTEDYRVYLIYDPSAGDTDWHFHPFDSQVQSGSVSIRINN